MLPKILATGASPEFVNSVVQILPDENKPVVCPAVYINLKQTVSTTKFDYFLLCLDQERDNTISTYRRMLREGLLDETEIVIVGKAEACRVLSKEQLFLRARFFVRPINVNDFREVLATPLKRENAENEGEEEETVINEPQVVSEDPEDSKKHILIVDDELQQVLLIKSLLTGFYTVTAVTNGPDARKYLSRHTADLILLDYVMAGENGIETFNTLKENPATADIPVIFLTSVNDAETVLNIIKLKPEGYLVKPVKRADLVARIISVLDEAQEKKKQP